MDNKRNNIHLIYSALKSEGYTDMFQFYLVRLKLQVEIRQ